MKVRKITVENVRSFLEEAEFIVDGDISIIIGPNGGGKTNLLDVLTINIRRHILKSWTWVSVNDPRDMAASNLTINDALNNFQLERHSHGAGMRQRVTIEIELTTSDIDNIRAMMASAQELIDNGISRYRNSNVIQAAANWQDTPFAGHRVIFEIIDDQVQPLVDPIDLQIQEYLGIYEAESILRELFERNPLSIPLVFLPVNRTMSGFQAKIELPHHNEAELRKSLAAVSSKHNTSVANFAVGRLAKIYRELQEENNVNASEAFRALPQIQSLSNELAKLDYDWDLVCINPIKNEYDVEIKKQGTSFLVSAASSGEKELLTYLFSIYALNIREALIIVDEPELHLHPRWQGILLGIFESLSQETGNQFILATHSPVFVSPSSIEYVSRVYSENQRSRIIRLNNQNLPIERHLFSIVNSQNNEKMFFADRVILVEGISDRVFFSALMNRFNLQDRGKVFEIISAGGKNFFEAYKRLLNAGQVPYVIIADQDYVREVGTNRLKELFTLSGRRVVERVIDDPNSIDGATVITRLEEAIESGNTDDLRALWEYIKSRHTILRDDLSQEEQGLLTTFIAEQRESGLFILAKGAIEKYMPDGYRRKDVSNIIRLVEQNYWPMLEQTAQEELTTIMEGISDFV